MDQNTRVLYQPSRSKFLSQHEHDSPAVSCPQRRPRVLRPPSPGSPRGLYHWIDKSRCLHTIPGCAARREEWILPSFRPGKGHKYSQLLFVSRVSVHSRREVENSPLSRVMASETIATYMALRAGIIGQHRHSFIRLLRSHTEHVQICY